MNHELGGAKNIFSGLTSFSHEPRKRGRPPSVQDQSLINQRDSLMSWLDGSWGRIGWKLQTAKTVGDIRDALLPLDTGGGHAIGIFAHATERKAMAKTLRLRKKEVADFNEEVRVASLRERASQEALDRVKAALQQANAKQKAEFAKILEERALAHDQARQEYEDLLRKDHLLRQRFDDERAYFAQNELLRFIRSRRYSFNPVNLANAMAGLPEMGWRQSAKRCVPHKPQNVPGMIFWLFRFIVNAISESKSTGLPLVQCVKGRLQNYKDQTDYRLLDAKRNCYHLRRAIESTKTRKHHPRSLPYRITATYQHHRQCQNAVELFHQEEEQLR